MQRFLNRTFSVVVQITLRLIVDAEDRHAWKKLQVWKDWGHQSEIIVRKSCSKEDTAERVISVLWASLHG